VCTKFNIVNYGHPSEQSNVLKRTRQSELGTGWWGEAIDLFALKIYFSGLGFVETGY